MRSWHTSNCNQDQDQYKSCYLQKVDAQNDCLPNRMVVSKKNWDLDTRQIVTKTKTNISWYLQKVVCVKLLLVNPDCCLWKEYKVNTHQMITRTNIRVAFYREWMRKMPTLFLKPNYSVGNRLTELSGYLTYFGWKV